jgi:hypothetical protein
MDGITADCPDCDPEEYCEELRRQIHRLVLQRKAETGTRGLRERYVDQIYGRHGPGTEEWRGHQTAIQQIKNTLKRMLRDFNNNNCPDLTPIARDVTDWINKPLPLSSHWKGPQLAPIVQPEPGIGDWKYWEELTGLTGAALLTYLIISQGSRLFPPRNLVPIP